MSFCYLRTQNISIYRTNQKKVCCSIRRNKLVPFVCLFVCDLRHATFANTWHDASLIASPLWETHPDIKKKYVRESQFLKATIRTKGSIYREPNGSLAKHIVEKEDLNLNYTFTNAVWESERSLHKDLSDMDLWLDIMDNDCH